MLQITVEIVFKGGWMHPITVQANQMDDVKVPLTNALKNGHLEIGSAVFNVSEVAFINFKEVPPPPQVQPPLPPTDSKEGL